MPTLRTAFAALLILLISTSAKSIDFDALGSELTQQKTSSTESKLALWMAPEFILGSNPEASEADRKRVAAMLDGYAIFLVVNAKVGAMGALSPPPRSQILSTTFLHLDETSSLRPVPDAELKGDIKVFLDVMKPIFKSLAGNYGEAMETVVFRDAGADGRSRLHATDDGKVRLSVAEESFVWRLPLGALLPPAIDPVSKEQFPGNFLYSPYTGRKLEKK